MIPASKEQFLATLRAGDIGISLARNPFAILQDWYRRKFKEGELAASHGFYFRKPPQIIEADGIFVSKANIFKNIGDKTKVWVFRYARVAPSQIDLMNVAADVAVDVGGHYSVGGLAQFALQFIGLRKKLADESGVFCTEFTGHLIMYAGLPYVKGKRAFEVDPSYQLNWMLGAGKDLGWVLAASYDGAGNYLISV